MSTQILSHDENESVEQTEAEDRLRSFAWFPRGKDRAGPAAQRAEFRLTRIAARLGTQFDRLRGPAQRRSFLTTTITA
jgi:hypothetical protein